MILIWRYAGRFTESRFFRTKIKRDTPSENSGDWDGGDFPWTDEAHAGTAALRLLTLYTPTGSGLTTGEVSWICSEDLRGRRNGRGPPAGACPSLAQRYKKRCLTSENFLICFRSSCLI